MFGVCVRLCTCMSVCVSCVSVSVCACVLMRVVHEDNCTTFIHMHFYCKYLCENLINYRLIVLLTLCMYTGQMLYVNIAISTVCAKLIFNIYDPLRPLYLCRFNVYFLPHPCRIEKLVNQPIESSSVLMCRKLWIL